jgi:photosynthetic reaction center cytochrome c subunit
MTRVNGKLIGVGAVLLATGLAGCERPRWMSCNAATAATAWSRWSIRACSMRMSTTVPDAVPPVAPAGPKAGDIYKNVQVLGDLSAA